MADSLQENPTDYAVAEQLGSGIARAADGLPDPSTRTSIKRCAAAATVPVDPPQLRACLDKLLRATQPLNYR